MGKMAQVCVGASTGAMLGSLCVGGLEAANGAVSGAVGAAVLKAAGYTGYSALEASKMGAIGGAVLGASMGVCAGGLAGSALACGLFGRSVFHKKTDSSSFCTTLVAHVAVQTIAGMLGWALMNAGEKKTAMDLGRAAAALATGSAVTMLPAACITLCITIPLLLAAVACVVCLVASANSDHDSEEMSSLLIHA